MTAVMAIGIGLMLTAIAVAIGGLTVEAVLLLIQYRLKAVAAADAERAGTAFALRFDSRDDLAEAVELTNKAAA